MFSYRISPDVSLELLGARHAAELFALTEANREHLRRWLPWVDGTRSVHDTTAFIQGTRQQFANNSGFQTAIRFREALVGVIGYHGINWSNKATTIGYWLAENAQGQGVMTKSCQALVDHAFRELGFTE